MTISIKAQEVLSPEPPPPELKRGLRLYAGLAAAILSIILPAFVIIVPSLGLPAQWTVILSAGLFIGGPEMLTLAAVVLLGKDTLRYFIKSVGV